MSSNAQNPVTRNDLLANNAKVSSSLTVPGYKDTSLTPQQKGSIIYTDEDDSLFFSDGFSWNILLSSPIPFPGKIPQGAYLVGNNNHFVLAPFIGGDTSLNLGLGSMASGSGTNSVAVGVNTLNSNTGSNNTALGYNALKSNTVGVNNTAIGQSSGSDIVSGSGNVLLGNNTQAGAASSTNRIVIGNNVTGVTNNSVTIGGITSMYIQNLQAAKTATILYYNPVSGLVTYEVGGGGGGAVVTSSPLQGDGSGGDPVTMAQATSFGQYLAYNSSTFSWEFAPAASMSGLTNVPLGIDAMNSAVSGLNNVAIGYEPMSLLTSGSDNIGLGTSALAAVLDGSRNIGLGTSSLFLLTSGTDNIAFGKLAGADVTTGTSNILIGSNSTAGSATAVGRMVLGSTTGVADNSLTVAGTGFYFPSLSTAEQSRMIVFNPITGQITYSNYAFPAGSAPSPGMYVQGDPNTGFFSGGADTLSIAAGGTEILRSTTTQVLANVGSVGSPSYSFVSSPTSGLYSPGVNSVALATNGISRLSMDTAAITASLPLTIPNGTAGAPSLNFSSSTTTGLYSSTPNVLGFAASGSEKATLSSSALTSLVPVLGVTGTAASPSFSFSSDTNSGIYSSASDEIGVSTGGTQRLNISSNSLVGSIQLLFGNGTATDPTYSYSSDPKTGIFLSAAKTLGISTDGTSRITVSDSNLTSTLPFLLPAGTVGVPSYSFTDDPTSGNYFTGGVLRTAIGGVNILNVGSTSVDSTVPYRGATGTAGTPTFSFTSQPTIGMYASGANTLGFSTDGTERLALSKTALTSTVQILNSNGSTTAPSYSFSSSTGTGMFSDALNTLKFSAGSTNFMTATSTEVTLAVPIEEDAGSAAAPSYSFSTASDTGMYLSGTSLGFAVGGTQKGLLNTSGQWLMGLGTNALPSYSFDGDVNTGIYSSAADTINLTTGGTSRVALSTSALSSTLPVREADGSAATPSYSFTSYPDAGMYVPSANTLGFSTEGVLRMTISAGGITPVSPIVLPLGSVTAPSLTFVGDLNTGVYSSGADTFDITTGGTNRLSISSSTMDGSLPLRITGTTNYLTVNTTDRTYKDTNAGAAVNQTIQIASSTSPAGTGYLGVSNTASAADVSLNYNLSNLGGNIIRTAAILGNIETGNLPASRTTGAEVGNLVFYAKPSGSSVTEVARMGMNATNPQMVMTDGVASAPSIAFSSDLGLGMFRSASNTLGFATNGTERVTINTTTMTNSLVFSNSSGTNAAPSYSFTGDLTTGMYRVGASTVGLTTGGTLRSSISTTEIVNTLPLRGPSGDATTPSYSFSADSDTGLYNTAGLIGFTTDGTSRATLSSTALTTTVPFRGPNGLVSAPTYSFSGSTNMGIYSAAGSTVDTAIAGVNVESVSSSAITTTIRYLSIAGAAATPTYSFSGDTNSGMYSVGADIVGIAANGTLTLQISASGTESKVPFLAPDGSASAPGYGFSSATNTGLYRASGTEMDMTFGGTRYLRYTTDGISVFNDTNPYFMLGTGSSKARWYIRNSGVEGGGDTGSDFYLIPRNDADTTDLRNQMIITRSSGKMTYAGDIVPGTNNTFDLGAASTGLWNSTFSTTFYGSAGAVGTPSFTFDGDENTGMYRSSADQLSFAAGGVQMAVMDAATTLTRINGLLTTNISSSAFGMTNASITKTGTLFVSPTSGLGRIAHEFNTTTNTEAREWFLVNNGTNNIAIAGFESTAPSTTPGSETGRLVFYTKPSGGAASACFTLYEDQTTRFVSGTASAPSITFDGDNNTGIYRVGADSLGMSTNGTSRLAISTSEVASTLPISITNVKKVTIGASGSQAADYTLTLPVDDGTSGQALTTNGSGVLSWSTVLSSVSTSSPLTGDGSGGNPVRVDAGSGYGQYLGWNGSSWAIAPSSSFSANLTAIALGFNALNVTATGTNNIAIGYNTGSLMTSGDSNNIIGGNAGATIKTGTKNQMFGAGAGGDIVSGGSNICIGHGALAGSTSASGRIVIGTSISGAADSSITTAVPFLSTSGTVSAPTYSFSGDQNTGIYNSAADTVNVSTGGTSRLAISTSEVASTLPISITNVKKVTLQASGSQAADYTLTLPVDDGVAGEVLSTDGAGVLSWIAGGGAVTTESPLDGDGSGGDPIRISAGTTFGEYLAYNSTSSKWVVAPAAGLAGATNVALGSSALNSTMSGTNNVGIGIGPLVSLTTGTDNIGIGSGVLDLVADGAKNIGIGTDAGKDITSGSSNIIIGYGSTAGSATASGRVVIGNSVAGVSDNAMTLGIPILGPSGSVSSPTYAFSGATNSGMYYDGSLQFPIGGTSRATLSTGAGGQWLMPFGTSAAPSYAFASSTNTGMNCAVAGTLVLSTGGTTRVSLTSLSMQVVPPIRESDGSAGAPTFSFGNSTTTGMYHAGSDVLGLSAGGTDRLTLSSASATFGPVLYAPAGSVSAPSYSFSGDPNTGIYNSGADVLDFATNGTNRLSLSATDASFTVPIATTNVKKVTIQASASQAADYTLTLPVDDGAAGEVLSTDGAGVLSWIAAGGTVTTSTPIKGDGSGGDPITIDSGTTFGQYLAYNATSTTWIISPAAGLAGATNVPLGSNAMNSTMTGTNNVGIGIGPLVSITKGTDNIAIGTGSLDVLTEGNNNIGIGTDAGKDVTTGSSNIIVGYGSVAGSATASGRIVIGNSLTGTTDNTLLFGVPALGPAGSVSAPTYSFSGDPNTGMYNSAADTLVLTTAGTTRMTVDTTSITSTLPYYAPNGSASAPSFTFTNDTNTGLYYTGTADTIALTTGGTARMTINTANITNALQTIVPDGSTLAPGLRFTTNNTGISMPVSGTIAFTTNGISEFNIQQTLIATGIPIRGHNATAGAPTYSFSGTTTAGMYLSGTNTLGFSTSSTLRLSISTASLTSTLPYYAPAGTNSAPSYTFTGDTNTGMYNASVDVIGFAANGNNRFNISNTYIEGNVPYIGQAGSAAAPTYSFTADLNTGIYSAGADSLGLSTGGTLRLTLDTAALTNTLPYVGPLGSASAATYAFTGDLNTGIYSSGADTLNFTTGGTSRLAISTSEVGSTLPISITNVKKVTIGASALQGADYTLTLPVDDGTSGQVLVTDGSGVLSWSSTAAGTVTTAAPITGDGSIGNPVTVANGTAFGQYLAFNSDTSTWVTAPSAALSGTTNIAIGSTALNSTLTGTDNIAIGVSTAKAVTKGNNNVIIGNGAGNAITEGSSNIAVGLNAGNDVTTGGTNIIIGGGSTAGSATAAGRIVIGSSLAGVADNTLLFGVPVLGPSGSNTAPTYSFSGDTNTGIYSSAADTINLTTGGTSRFALTTTGATSTLPFYLPDGTVGAPAFSFSSSTNTGLYYSATQINFGTAGVFRLAMAATGIFSTVAYYTELGSNATPTFSFTSDTNTGMYSPGADTIGFTTGGTLRYSISSTVVTATIPYRQANGSAAAPSFSFTNATTSGLYYTGTANTIALSTNSTARLTINTASVTSSLPFYAPNGSQTAPGYSFSGDTNTGIYQTGTADTMALTTGGTARVTLNTASLTSTLPFYAPAGTNSAPSHSFSTDTNTGMYSASADVIGFAANGNNRFNISNTYIEGNVPFIGQAGSAAAPTYSFTADLNTGIYSAGADSLGLSTGGTLRLTLGTATFDSNLPIRITGTTNYLTINTTDNNYRLTDGGSDVAQALQIASNTVSAGFSALGLDYAGAATDMGLNGNIFNTSSRYIRAASIVWNVSTGSGASSRTAGSEIGNMVFYVKPSSSAIVEAARVFAGSSSAAQFGFAAGTAALPSICFTTNPTTGFYRSASDTIGLTTSGTLRVSVDTASLTSTLPFLGPAGSAGSPAYSFSGDSNTGIYNSTTDTITFSTNGTGRVSINTANLISDLPIIAPAGSNSAPSYTFNSDTNTGFYSYGADQIGMTCGGTNVGRFFNAGFIMGGNIFTDLTPSGGTLHWYLRTNGSVLRNAIGMSATESGSDTGSNLAFWNYTDAGSFKAQIYENERSTNNNTFWGRLWAGQTASLTIPSIGFLSQTDCGLTSFYTDQIDFITNSVHRFSMTNNSILPSADAAYNLGSSGLRMNTIYASVGAINTSDRNLKDDITDCTLGLDFVNKLKPKRYKWKNRTYEEKYRDKETNEEKTRIVGKIHTRYHYGLIAQDIKDTLDEIKIDPKDFAGYVDSKINEPDKPQTFGLNYAQFIPPLIKAIQELSQKVQDLENQLLRVRL